MNRVPAERKTAPNSSSIIDLYSEEEDELLDEGEEVGAQEGNETKVDECEKHGWGDEEEEKSKSFISLP